MAPPDQQQYNFWDWIQSFDPPGRGVDHQPGAPPFGPFPGAGFPFGFGGPGPHSHQQHHPPPPPHGAHPPPPPYAHWGQGPWGPPHHHADMNADDDEVAYTPTSDNERGDPEKNEMKKKEQASPDTMQDDVPDPDEVVPEDEPRRGRHHGWGRGRGRGCGHRRGGGRWRGGGGRGGFFGPRFPHHDHHDHHDGHHPHHQPGPPPFDWASMFRGWANHPIVQQLREQAENFRPAAGNTTTDGSSSFAPPVDVFNTDRAFVVHVALPGAKKEDIGVSWDADRRVLAIAGVVHRPGDEEFLKTLASAERRVGMFERTVALPPAGVDSAQRDEVDATGIAAKMEDGVLVITVPKTERDWTEIHKVDIE